MMATPSIAIELGVVCGFAALDPGTGRNLAESARCSAAVCWYGVLSIGTF
jgi:hypothetical protein